MIPTIAIGDIKKFKNLDDWYSSAWRSNMSKQLSSLKVNSNNTGQLLAKTAQLLHTWEMLSQIDSNIAAYFKSHKDLEKIIDKIEKFNEQMTFFILGS